MLMWLVAIVLFYLLYVRLRGTDGTESVTLYDPTRLRAVLQRFLQTTAPADAATPQRQRHRTEALCRTLLEQGSLARGAPGNPATEWMLRIDLPKCRPPWLVNPTTRRKLELDMYNAERRLAFEYDGAQHDVYTPHYHRGSEDHFAYRCLLDRLKSDLCRERGITLIRIPWEGVSAGSPTRTARCLESLLSQHGIPFRSALKDQPTAATDRRDPLGFVRRSPSPQSPATEAHTEARSVERAPGLETVRHGDARRRVDGSVRRPGYRMCVRSTAGSTASETLASAVTQGATAPRTQTEPIRIRFVRRGRSGDRAHLRPPHSRRSCINARAGETVFGRKKSSPVAAPWEMRQSVCGRIRAMIRPGRVPFHRCADHPVSRGLRWVYVMVLFFLKMNPV